MLVHGDVRVMSNLIDAEPLFIAYPREVRAFAENPPR
jgi:hypothetical protein